jgi:hypothetical protein
MPSTPRDSQPLATVIVIVAGMSMDCLFPATITVIIQELSMALTSVSHATCFPYVASTAKTRNKTMSTS